MRCARLPGRELELDEVDDEELLRELFEVVLPGGREKEKEEIVSACASGQPRFFPDKPRY